MLDILAFAKFAGPSAVGKLSGCMGRLPVFIHVQRDFLVSLLNIRVSAWSKSNRTEHFDEGIKGFLQRNVWRPVSERPSNGPPPSLSIASCPRYAIVLRGRRARDRISRTGEMGKHGFEVFAHQVSPCSLPHLSQASVIFLSLPRSSGLTGSAPVIAVSAQNQ